MNNTLTRKTVCETVSGAPVQERARFL